MNFSCQNSQKSTYLIRHLFLFCWILLPAFVNAQPNILLIFSDDLNTRIGPYMELDKHTPNLDKLANKGVMFSRAYCQYPLCGPSRASIMSGLYPATNGVLANDDKPGSYKKTTPVAIKLLKWFFLILDIKLFNVYLPGKSYRRGTGL